MFGDVKGQMSLMLTLELEPRELLVLPAGRFFAADGKKPGLWH